MGQNADAPSPAPQTDADLSDAYLLRRYVRDGSQAAFAALVRRYGGLVHATCLREVDDPHLAEDITQVVFLLLARKAPSLLRADCLAGWLFRAARFSARNTFQQLLGQVHAHYKGLASFSALVTRQGSFATAPGGIVQQLRWLRGGRFDLHRIAPDSAWWPDIYADGSQEVAVFPKSGKRRTRALNVSASEFQEWPVAGGEILEWLQSTPASEKAFSPNLDKTIIWQFGPRTSWHGQKAKEIIATGQLPKKTGQVSFFVDEARQELIGVELLTPSGGKLWDYLYTDQKENPLLPTTLGNAP